MIDLSETTCIGFENGVVLRHNLKLDLIDDQEIITEVCSVKLPENAIISHSFFRGLFGPSVLRAGTMGPFYRRYRFEGPEALKKVIDGHVLRVLCYPDLAERTHKKVPKVFNGTNTGTTQVLLRAAIGGAMGALLAHMGYSMLTWEFWVAIALLSAIALTELL